MTEKIKSFFRFFIAKKQEKADFSHFFRNASEKDTQRLMENVVRRANEDQKAILEQYEES